MIARYRLLVLALFLSLAVHVLALVAMVTVLAPGVDMNATALARATYMAAHPWLWRLGWLAWQLTAASDLFLSVAVAAYFGAAGKERARLYAVGAVVATVLAVIPDQWAELLLDTAVVEAARAAVASPASLAAFVSVEARTLLLTGTCGAFGYTLMGVFWMLAVAAGLPPSPRRRAFLALGSVTWILFVGTTIANWYSTTRATVEGYPSFGIVFGLNAVAFPLLLVFMVGLGVVVAEAHHGRFDTPARAVHRLRAPGPGILGHALELVPHLRDLARYLPSPPMRSDVTDVVYLNWMVPAERVAALLPAPLRATMFGGETVVSILTYRHGHFGPTFLGPLRKLLPSPHQSNWRLYVEPEREGAPPGAIVFVKCIVSDLRYVAGSRLLSDGLPSHLPLSITHAREGDRIVTSIDPGAGSAPDLRSEVRVGGTRTLPADFARHFPTWDDAVRYLVDQNRAVAVFPALGRLHESPISIPIAVSEVQPLVVNAAESRWLAPFVGDSPCFAFLVPSVPFSVLGESFTADL